VSRGLLQPRRAVLWRVTAVPWLPLATAGSGGRERISSRTRGPQRRCSGCSAPSDGQRTAEGSAVNCREMTALPVASRDQHPKTSPGQIYTHFYAINNKLHVSWFDAYSQPFQIIKTTVIYN
jgi:hypothetical protein